MIGMLIEGAVDDDYWRKGFGIIIGIGMCRL
jgi:hypothetical protein